MVSYIRSSRSDKISFHNSAPIVHMLKVEILHKQYTRLWRNAGLVICKEERLMVIKRDQLASGAQLLILRAAASRFVR